MLTPDQMQALQDALTSLADPVTAFIVKDVIRRITEAGKITRTAEYQLKQAIWLKKSKSDIKALIRDKNLPKEVSELFTKAVETAANQMGIIKPLEEDEELQNILSAAVKLAEDDFTNITQTLGMVDPYGNALPLQKAYRSCTDYAFKNVLSGAQSYQQACYEATKNLISQGVQVVDYESGVHTSVEAAVRRNIFGGMGLMVEQVQDHWHDEMNATGWELSAHEACAVDHEPYQGRQYTNEEYEALNGTAEHPGRLQRRIGTLNCKHIAFPVMIGIQKPIYSDEELQAMKERNQKGITFEGKHYTMYEATQMQRKLERAIRAQRRKIAALEELPDQEDKLKAARVRYTVLTQKYKEFSKAAGLKTQDARTLTVGFGPKQEIAAQRTAVAQNAITHNTVSTGDNSVSSVTQDTENIISTSTEDFKPEYEELQEYTVNGKPYVVDGKAVVQDHDDYEKQDALTLSEYLKEKIYLVPKINKPDGISVPDYITESGVTYEQKGPESNKLDCVFNSIQGRWDQSERFVVNISKTKYGDMDAIIKQASRVFVRERTQFVKRLIIILDDKIVADWIKPE